MSESNPGKEGKRYVEEIAVFQFTDAARRGLKIGIAIASLVCLMMLWYIVREENGMMQAILVSLEFAWICITYAIVQTSRRSKQTIECSSTALSEKRGGALIRQITWKDITEVRSHQARPNPVLAVHGVLPRDRITVDFGIANLRGLLQAIADHTRESLLMPSPIVLGRRPARRFFFGCSLLVGPCLALSIVFRLLGSEEWAVIFVWAAGAIPALVSLGFALTVLEVGIDEDRIRLRRMRGTEEIQTRDIVDVLLELAPQPLCRPTVSVVLRDGSKRELSFFNVEVIPFYNSLRKLLSQNSSTT